MDMRGLYLIHKYIPVCLLEISDDGNWGSARRNATAALYFLH